MRRKWGSGSPRLEVIRPGGMPGKFLALLVVLPTDNPFTRHHLTGEQAELVWWQVNNHLLGFGLGDSEGEAAERALAAADRGTIARLGLTVWFERGTRKFKFFRRSSRNDLTYKPAGAEITAQDTRALNQ